MSCRRDATDTRIFLSGLLGLMLVLPLSQTVCAQDQSEKDLAFAEGLYAQEQYEMAAGKYVDFVKRYPGHANLSLALFRSGECLFRLDKFADAATYFARVTAEFPNSEEAEPGWLWLGDARYQAGEYLAAAQAYESLLAKFPESDHVGRAGYWRGESYYQLGEYQKAIDAYTAAMKGKLGAQETAYALYSIGLCHLQLGQHQEALPSLQQVVAKYSGFAVVAEAQYLIGAAYHSLTDFPNAIKAYEKVLAEHADSRFAPRAQLRIGWCYFQQADHGKALAAFQKTAATYSQDPAGKEAALRAADCLFKLKRWPEAAEAYTKVAEDKQSQWAPEALLWLAATYESQKEPDKALAAYKKLVAEHKDSPLVADAHSHSGQLHIDAERYPEAIASYEAAVQAAKNPTQKRQAMAGLSWAKYQKDGSGQSLADLEKIVGEDPKSQLAGDLSCQLARAYYEEAKCQEALGVLEPFLANHPDHASRAEGLFLSGACHEKLGAEDKAQEFYLKAMAEGAESEYAGHATSALAGLYARSGNVDKAKELAVSLEASSAPGPVIAYALYQVARAMQKGENHAAAADLYARSLAKDPAGETAPYAQLGLGWAKLGTGDAEGAAEAFRAAAEKYADSEAVRQLPDGLIAAAEKLYEDEKYTEASALYGQVVTSFPESELVGEAMYKQAWILLQQDRADEAPELFVQAAQKAKSEEVAADARYQASVLLSEKGDWAQVTTLLEPFLRQYGDSEKAPWALALLAEALTRTQQSPQALAAGKLLVEKHAEHEAAAIGHLLVARDLRAAKQVDQALAKLAKALELGKGNVAAQAQFEVAGCFVDKGQLQEATEEFLKVSILHKSPEWGARAQYEAGQTFERLDNAASAIKSYEAIEKRYPEQQEWITKARQRLEQLNQ